jgi:GNAT superfamily N-acetyltransferase
VIPRHKAGAPAGIVRAGDADAGVLSQVIADAFFPLAPCRWLIGDEAARREVLPAYFRMHVEHTLADGIVHTTPARDAAALWIPLGALLPHPPGSYAEQLARVTGPWAGRFTAFDAELDAHHLTGTAHHHLAILAVRPDRQGHGTGTALLHAHHAVLDELGVTAYLEASGQDTRGLYLRHGYILRPDAPIRLPDGGPEMWPMVRYPQPVRDVP